MTTGEETFKSDATKIHKHKSGKLLAVSFGNHNISVTQLQKLGFKVNKKEFLMILKTLLKMVSSESLKNVKKYLA